MAEPIRTTLSRDELIAVTALAGVTPGPESPLPAGAGPATQAAIDLLREKAVVDQNGRLRPEWSEPVATLAAPRSRFTAILIAPTNDLAAADYYLARNAIVSWGAFGADGCVISSPMDLQGIFSAIAAWMGTAHLTESVGFSETLSAAEFTALVAILDAYREERVRALLDRRAIGENGFTPELLRRQIATSPVGDSRWLGGIIARCGLGRVALDLNALEPGVSQLAQRGWVDVHDAGVDLLEPCADLCEDIGSVLPCASCGTSSAAGQSSMLAVHGRRTFWVFSERDGGSSVGVTAATGAELETLIQQELTAFTTTPAAPPARAAARCPACSAAVERTAAFCSACGTPLKQPAAATPQPGTSRVAPPPPPPPRACGGCGARLKPGLRFCTACGARVAEGDATWT